MKPTLEETEAVVAGVVRGEVAFDDGLRAVVRYQRAWIPELARYWEQHGFSGEPSSPDDVPGVPTDVFKSIRLVSGEREARTTFMTSGTTHGARGVVPRLSTAMYDYGALRQFGACVPCADDAVFPSLVFDPADAPESSLSHMVALLGGARGGAAYFLDPERGVDAEGFVAAWASARSAPIVFGTAFAFVHLLDALADTAVPPGPDGSVFIETGGFKGRSRVVERAWLHNELRRRFGATVRSEYSMTELSSQLYTCADAPAPFRAPRWCQVSAVDPTSLAPLPAGTPGLLRFVDLANVDVPVVIQTSDLGVVDAGGVHLEGRAADATPRGCSLAIEEILELQERNA